ncbi:Ig-like domain-containing protein [Streptomyces sp. SS7]|uniref:Ig-like domain-containing protein n=1 Tax=Streptomyces sp. SS7 TaxID=3108485 RepID=UPI0030ECADAF
MASIGAAVELTATVTCASDPGGGLGMTFFDGADLLGTVAVAANGQARFTASFTALGTHTITAAYNGNESCDASSGTAPVSVSAAPVTPTVPPGLCLLTCGGLLGFVVGDIHNNIIIG